MTHQYFKPSSNDPDDIAQNDFDNKLEWLKEALEILNNMVLTPEQQLEIMDYCGEEIRVLKYRSRKAQKTFFKAQSLERTLNINS